MIQKSIPMGSCLLQNDAYLNELINKVQAENEQVLGSVLRSELGSVILLLTNHWYGSIERQKAVFAEFTSGNVGTLQRLNLKFKKLINLQNQTK